MKAGTTYGGMDDRARFWSNVRRGKKSDCWGWDGSHTNKYCAVAGVKHYYGQAWFCGKLQLAHRVMWELTQGPIPKRQCVLHTCDKACVNPKHLYVGSKKDNAADRESRGRGVRTFGVDNKSHKLVPSQVRDIRDLAAHGWKHHNIAEAYLVSDATIRQVVCGKTWRCV